MADGITFFGQLDSPLPPAELASALEGGGIAATLRESSHYAGGTYVRIDLGAAADFTLERTGDREYLARADADDDALLVDAARRVSAALAHLGRRHRFELYAPGLRLAEYLHHDWPRAASGRGAVTDFRAERIGPERAGAVLAVLVACGADLARRGHHNWTPPYALERLIADVAEREVWAVWTGDDVVATFTLGTTPPHPDDPPAWREPGAPTLYLSRLAVLPASQGHGVGAWCMGQVERRARELSCRAVRFDVLAANAPLRAFYERRGYQARGERTRGAFTFTCYDLLLD